MSRRACLRFAAVLLALHGGLAAAGELDPGPEILWVGPGAGCTHTDIQAAIDAASASRGAEIRIVGDTWTAVQLHVHGKDIALQGGHVACLDGTVDGRSMLTNLPRGGAPGTSVLRITGNARVSASRIAFVDGGSGQAAIDGGGIAFDGTGSLTLADVIVRNNHARDGAGISMHGNGGAALLWLLAKVRIDQNQARGSGGGILLAGDATLRVHSPDVSIAGNVAQQDGGGMAILDGAHAVIGSGSAADPALVDGNGARRGGGIAVLGASATRASSLRMFSIDARHATQLRNNTAWQDGGGLFAGLAGVPAGVPGVEVCVSDTRIEGNRASDGAAVFASGEDAATRAAGTLQPPWVLIGTRHDAAGCPGPEPVAYGARACVSGVPCNTLIGNDAMPTEAARDAAPSGGGPVTAPGAVLVARSGALLLVDAGTIRHNAASGALLLAADDAVLHVTASTLTNNFALDALLQTDASGIGLTLSTVADNDIGGPLLRNAGVIAIAASILDSGEAPLYAGPSAALDLDYVLANRLDGLPAGTHSRSLVGEARFVDRAHGNFRLAPGTLAIDFAEAPIATLHDPDGNERGIDAPQADRHGPLDLGAYEWTPGFVPGRLFADGLEDPQPPAAVRR